MFTITSISPEPYPELSSSFFHLDSNHRTFGVDPREFELPEELISHDRVKRCEKAGLIMNTQEAWEYMRAHPNDRGTQSKRISGISWSEINRDVPESALVVQKYCLDNGHLKTCNENGEWFLVSELPDGLYEKRD